MITHHNLHVGRGRGHSLSDFVVTIQDHGALRDSQRVGARQTDCKNDQGDRSLKGKESHAGLGLKKLAKTKKRQVWSTEIFEDCKNCSTKSEWRNGWTHRWIYTLRVDAGPLRGKLQGQTRSRFPTKCCNTRNPLHSHAKCPLETEAVAHVRALLGRVATWTGQEMGTVRSVATLVSAVRDKKSFFDRCQWVVHSHVKCDDASSSRDFMFPPPVLSWVSQPLTLGDLVLCLKIAHAFHQLLMVNHQPMVFFGQALLSNVTWRLRSICHYKKSSFLYVFHAWKHAYTPGTENSSASEMRDHCEKVVCERRYAVEK